LLGAELETLSCFVEYDINGATTVTFEQPEATALRASLERLAESAALLPPGTLAAAKKSLADNLAAFSRRKLLSEALRTQVTALSSLAVTSYHTQALRLRRLKAVPLVDANFAARRRLLAAQGSREAILLKLISASTGAETPSGARPLASLRAVAVGRRLSQCFVDTALPGVRTEVDPANNLPLLRNATFVVEDLTFVAYLTPLASVQLSGQAVAAAADIAELMLTGERCVLTLDAAESASPEDVARLYLSEPSRSTCTSFDPDAETTYADTFVVIPDVPDAELDDPGDIAVAKALRRDVTWRTSAVRTSLPPPGAAPRPRHVCRRSAAEDLAVSHPSGVPEPDLLGDDEFIRFVAASLTCPSEPRPFPAVAVDVWLARRDTTADGSSATFDWADGAAQLGRCLPAFAPNLGEPADWTLTSVWEEASVRVDVWSSAVFVDRLVWVVRGRSGNRGPTSPSPSQASEQVACVLGFEQAGQGCSWAKGQLPATIWSGWTTAELGTWCAEDLEDPQHDPWTLQAAELLAVATGAECTSTGNPFDFVEAGPAAAAAVVVTQEATVARPAHLFPVSSSRIASLSRAYRGFSEWQGFGRDLLRQAYQDPLPAYPDAQSLLGNVQRGTAYGLALRLSWNGNEATVVGVNASSPFYQRVLPRYASNLIVGWEQQEGELFYDLEALRQSPEACWHNDGEPGPGGDLYRVFGRTQGVFVESYVQLGGAAPATLCAWEAPMSGQSWDPPRAEALRFAKEGLFSERASEASVAEAALRQAVDVSQADWDAQSNDVSEGMKLFGEAVDVAKVSADASIAKYAESTNTTNQFIDALDSIFRNTSKPRIRYIDLLPADCSTVSSLWGENAGSCTLDMFILAFVTYLVVAPVIVGVWAIVYFLSKDFETHVHEE
jgi:hypothetical protein